MYRHGLRNGLEQARSLGCENVHQRFFLAQQGTDHESQASHEASVGAVAAQRGHRLRDDARRDERFHRLFEYGGRGLDSILCHDGAADPGQHLLGRARICKCGRDS